MDTKKLKKYLDVAATDTSVGATEYGEMTIPYAKGASDAEDAKTLSLTPLALRKDQGSLGDEHWQNPRRAHYWADRYLNMVKPPKGVSSQTGRKHSDGAPCKAKDPESCPLEKSKKKSDESDKGLVASGSGAGKWKFSWGKTTDDDVKRACKVEPNTDAERTELIKFLMEASENMDGGGPIDTMAEKRAEELEKRKAG